jgi:hypothetical protein
MQHQARSSDVHSGIEAQRLDLRRVYSLIRMPAIVDWCEPKMTIGLQLYDKRPLNLSYC